MTVAKPQFSRVVVLGAGALGAACRGLAYLPLASPPETSQLSPVEAWFPITTWGILWLLVGALLAASIVVPRLSIAGMSALTGLLALWGMSYMYAWAVMDVSRSWVTGGLFLMSAAWCGVMASAIERGR